MPIALPKPIADYFTADTARSEAIVLCFAEDAVVTDEKHTYAGRDAIGRWKADVAAKFAYVSEPFAIERDGDRAVVSSRVTGTFPGSPVDLRYRFTLDGDKIARLEIGP